MSNTRERIEILRGLLARRIVVLDGATGTSIQGMNLHEGYFGGPQLDGCNENLVITSPGRISELHRSFLEAGADIVETNSFGSTSVVLAEYGLERQARELNRISARQTARASSPARWARPPRASRSPAASPSINWPIPTRNRPRA
jgi:5-methyltetrahydrofolate--homocysteine methyltransferase